MKPLEEKKGHWWNPVRVISSNSDLGTVRFLINVFDKKKFICLFGVLLLLNPTAT